MTKDEFIDIMGKIDEGLIESALDTSQPKVVEVVYKRPSAVRYIMGIAACIAVLMTTVIAVPYFKGILQQPGSTSESSTDISISGEYDFIRGWNPEKLAYSSSDDFGIVGGNVRVCTAELDGITAELILHNIKKEAGVELVNELTDDYTDYIGAEDIVLYVHDDKGRRFIAEGITPHSYKDMELINVNCLFDGCTRLYKTDNSEYILMQYADCVGGTLIASFYNIDLDRKSDCDENGIYDASDWRANIVGDGRIGDWRYGCQASKKFEYAGGTKFQDPVYGNAMYSDGNPKVFYFYPNYNMLEIYEEENEEEIDLSNPDKPAYLESWENTKYPTTDLYSDVSRW